MTEQNSSENGEQQSTPPEGAEEQQQSKSESETKTFDADYVEKLRKEAAKYRTEAKANAEAAQRLAEIEEANKTEAGRQAERLQQAEERAKQLELKANRAEVASTVGVPAELLAGPEDSTPEALTAYAEKVIAFAEAKGAPRAPRPDANQGRSSSGPASTADQFAAVFNGALNS